jgi:hypothetical protein
MKGVNADRDKYLLTGGGYYSGLLLLFYDSGITIKENSKLPGTGKETMVIMIWLPSELSPDRQGRKTQFENYQEPTKEEDRAPGCRSREPVY